MSAGDKALRTALVHIQRSPEVARFSLSMMGTLTHDVSSASSTKDDDRRGERRNVCERAKILPPYLRTLAA
jgi:hypothetical protein